MTRQDSHVTFLKRGAALFADAMLKAYEASLPKLRALGSCLCLTTLVRHALKRAVDAADYARPLGLKRTRSCFFPWRLFW